MKLAITSDSAPLKVGDEFLKYEIRALLGHGDHAYVYEAVDPMLDRLVAIKLIPEPPNSRRDLVQRSLEQAPILRDLNHPNLVSVYDVGTVGDELVYIVMERLIGRTLRSLLVEQRTLKLEEVLSIGIQVAEGMSWAHVQQVIHRDLKPENVFITEKHVVKVINTGITSFIVPSGMTTEWGCVHGTLLYLSPEHIQGFGVTARSDIYSLGTLLYECLAGSPPALVGTGQLSLDEVTMRQISLMPPLLNELSPDVPESLAQLIQQMIAKEAVLRFGTMDEVAIRLREIQKQLLSESVDSSSENLEPRPYIVFPSSALGMKATQAKDEARAPEQVLAGAERLVNALSSAQSANVALAAVGTLDQRDAKPGARRTITGIAISLGVLAGIAFALLMSANFGPGSTGPITVAPSTGPIATKLSPSEAKTPNKSDGYAVGSQNVAASAATHTAPVINSAKTGSREQKAKTKSAVSSELVF